MSNRLFKKAVRHPWSRFDKNLFAALMVLSGVVPFAMAVHGDWWPAAFFLLFHALLAASVVGICRRYTGERIEIDATGIKRIPLDGTDPTLIPPAQVEAVKPGIDKLGRPYFAITYGGGQSLPYLPGGPISREELLAAPHISLPEET